MHCHLWSKKEGDLLTIKFQVPEKDPPEGFTLTKTLDHFPTTYAEVDAAIAGAIPLEQRWPNKDKEFWDRYKIVNEQAKIARHNAIKGL